MFFASFLLLSACLPTEQAADLPGLTPRFNPGGTDFWDTPWPSDDRLTPQGTLDLTNFPNGDQGLLAGYTEVYAEQVHGYSTMPVVTVAFESLPDDLTLPSPAKTLLPTASVQLIGLGDHCGQRVPLELQVVRGEDAYVPQAAIQAALVPGVPLPVQSTWAFVVTTHFGGKTNTPDSFEAALNEGSLASLKECDAVPTNLAMATVFTTQDPIATLSNLRDATMQVPAPEPYDWAYLPEDSVEGSYDSWVGTIDMPIFQEGTSPYWTEGGLVLDALGIPLVQRYEAVQFVVSVPLGVESPGVVIWQSGARASLTGWVNARLANAIRGEGLALVKFLPQFHDSRNVDGGDPDFHTYNYANPTSGRTVLLQEAADVITMMNVVEAGLPVDLGAPVGLIGHSQGAEVGAMVAAVEPRLNAYVLHGVGTYLSETIVHRTDPFDVPALLSDMFGIAEVSRFHPLIQLVQTGGDIVDPGNALGHWEGLGANVLVVDGFEDQDVYWVSMNTLVLGADATVAEPAGWDVDPLSVWQPDVAPLPLSGNRTSTSGEPRTVVAYLAADGDHYTLYDRAPLRAMAAKFLESAQDGAVPEVIQP
jgi:hypothetical protein